MWRRVPICRLGLGMMYVALCTLKAATAGAHDRTTSYSTWDIRGRDAQVTVRLSELDVTHFPWAATAGDDFDRVLGDYLTNHLQLRADGLLCPLSDGPRRLRAAAGRVVFEWRVACGAGALQISSDLLLDVVPSHLHFARVSRDGAAGLERVLSEHERTWGLADQDVTPSAQPSGTSLGGYIALGVEHILTGYDHLAFLLALLLVGGTFSEIAKVVTGFTVAHSITLGLTVLGYVRPDTAPVEALIGLSIALVAAENIWLVDGRGRGLPLVVAAVLAAMALAAAAGRGQVPAVTLAGLAVFTLCYFGLLRRAAQTASLRWAIAFIFGLVHGFGFAAVLGEAGLPADRVVHALFGFNVGVELGQLAIVATVWPTLRLVTRRRERLRLAIVEVGSSAVLALGVFWFASRTYG